MNATRSSIHLARASRRLEPDGLEGVGELAVDFVGFASGLHYIHPDKQPELWINEMGVAPTHRGRGLGKDLLKALFEVGRAQNCTAAGC
jgi:GNAT superfamily N-acetyltransferase